MLRNFLDRLKIAAVTLAWLTGLTAILFACAVGAFGQWTGLGVTILLP